MTIVLGYLDLYGVTYRRQRKMSQVTGAKGTLAMTLRTRRSVVYQWIGGNVQ